MSRGAGRVFRPKWNGRTSQVWWLDFSVRGERHRESSGVTSKREAQRIMRDRMGDRETGKVTGRPDRVVLAEYVKGEDSKEKLVGGLRWLHEMQYDLDGLRSKDRAQQLWNHIEKFFPAPTPVTAVTAVRLDQYAKSRLDAGAARQTVNNELSALRAGFNLAVEKKLLAMVPVRFDLPKVSNVREGFFEDGELALVLMGLPEYLRVVVQFLRYTGWRCREALNLTWDQVDRDGETMRLYARGTKGKAGRVFPYGAALELKALLDRQWEHRDGLFVFRNEESGCNHVPYQTLQKAFSVACDKAGCPDRIIHDLRRTAARDMIRAGLSEGEIMRLCGWKTRAMFDRYNVINEQDLALAIAKRYGKRAASTEVVSPS